MDMSCRSRVVINPRRGTPAKVAKARPSINALQHQSKAFRAGPHVSAEHGAAYLVVLDDDAFVDSTLRIAQHQRLAIRSTDEIAGGEQVDAAHLELRRQNGPAVAADTEFGEMRGAHLRLLEQRCNEAIG